MNSARWTFVLALLCSVTLVASAATKIFAAVDHATGPVLLPPHSVGSYAVSAFELLLAASILLKKYRRAGAIVGSMFLFLGAGYLLLRVTLGLPHCGCFGGRLRMSLWLHLALIGALMCAFAGLIAGSRGISGNTPDQGARR